MRKPSANKAVQYASPTEAKQAELRRTLEVDDELSQLDPNTRLTLGRITHLDIEETDRIIFAIERAKRIAVAEATGGAA
ncbi:hypothetical protein [Streptomyces sp. NPDC047043]|uniref:hypothetical protein n=1 Tax=Streptomyces sp. NPDC047043 TaxID=3154497 RepID=UPI0033C119E3